MKEQKVHSQTQWLVCEGLMRLGFRSARTIRLYGEEPHLISDPEPHENVFAVHGIAVKSAVVKRIRLPLHRCTNDRARNRG
jgi:hypothetical protein